MIEIPAQEIQIKKIPLVEFEERQIKVITETVWDMNTGEFYASRADFKNCTDQDIGYRVEADYPDRRRKYVYQVGKACEAVNIVLACRCGFGVFEYEGQQYMFPKLQLYEKMGLMAYQALRYQRISPRFVKYLSDRQNRRVTENKMESELYLKVIMSLGIVNDIDYEESRFEDDECSWLPDEVTYENSLSQLLY